MQQQEFAYLCERFVADQLTETEGNELFRLLQAEPARVDGVREHLFLDLDLKAILFPPDPGTLLATKASPFLDELALEAQRRQASVPVRSVPVAAKTERRSLLPAVLIGVLALVFGSLAVFQEFRLFDGAEPPEQAYARKPFTSLGKITACADARFDDDKPIYLANQRLAAGKIALADGMLEMQLNNGVRVVLEGPGEFQLNSAMNTFCRRGRLSVFVPEPAKGFEVATPLMGVRDLGTEFLLDVQAEATTLHVVTGEVESNWLTKEWHAFNEGGGVRIDVDAADAGVRVRRIPAESALFMTAGKVREKVDAFFQRRATAYDAMLGRFRSDPALLGLLDSDGNDVGGFRISADRKQPGSLPNRKALRFQRASDRVEFSTDRAATSLTLWASVRLDRFDRANLLLQSERFYDDAGILWQVDWRGAIQFHHRVGRDTRKYDTPPLIGPEHEGAWLRLGVVVDGEKRTVTHYLNDRRVAELPWEPATLAPGAMTIGNEPARRRKSTQRYWNGSIESLAVFGRALGESEMFFVP